MDDNERVEMVYVNKHGSLNLEPLQLLPEDNCSTCHVISTKPPQKICNGCYRAGKFQRFFDKGGVTMNKRKPTLKEIVHG